MLCFEKWPIACERVGRGRLHLRGSRVQHGPRDQPDERRLVHVLRHPRWLAHRAERLRLRHRSLPLALRVRRNFARRRRLLEGFSLKKLKITLYSTSDTIRSKIRTAFEGHGYHVVEVTDSTKATHAKGVNEKQQEGAIGRLSLPHKVDAVVSTSGLNSKIEGLAATCGLKQNRNDVYAVVLPEALDWLRGLLDRKEELVLVGADQAK